MMTRGASGANELISFQIGEQQFCVDIKAVREIRGWSPSTALPHSPDYVLGVINLRGIVLPVMDLSARLGFGAGTPLNRSVIIVVDIEGEPLGLMVDAVSDILTIDDSMIQSADALSIPNTQNMLRSIIAVDGRMIAWLNLSTVAPKECRAAA